MRKRRIIICTLLAFTVIAQLTPPTASARVAKPRLVILLSIDQMRPDYFERFGAKFSGGLKRIYTEGVVYTNADLNYSGTETGPGHATLVTGAYPQRHGILANEWNDAQTRQRVYCVEDKTAGSVENAGGGASPRHLAVNAIGDWLKAAAPASKVISVAGKDRSAVLMGGRRPDYAFWYEAKSGLMVTSDYYTRQAPDWVKAFNAADWTARNTPAAWTKLLPESAYSGPDDFLGERLWGPSRKFPHPFLRKTEHQRFSPYFDMLLLDFALAAIRAERLGQREAADLLCLGLSATDYIGHHYGPDSHEMQDHLLRLDRALGEFLAQVETLVGAGNTLIALSADHGVRANPEYLAEFKAIPTRRITHESIEAELAAINQQLQKEFGMSESIFQRGPALNYAAAMRAGVDGRKLERRLREALSRIAGVEDVFFRRELTDRKTPDRPYLKLYQRSYFTARGADFQLRFCEHCLVTSEPIAADHGSPYPADRRVPLIFRGAGVKAARIERRVFTVDVAPTLAHWLGLPKPRAVDGVVLKDLFRE